jgi:hypothetical protein
MKPAQRTVEPRDRDRAVMIAFELLDPALPEVDTTPDIFNNPSQ